MIFRTKPKQQDPWSQWGGRRARHVPYTVLDCEMTGLNPKKDQIVAIGACKIHQGQLDLGQTFYQVIKTDVPLSRENILIHRLTHSQIASGRP
ncbi:MAG: hypothetical protein KDC71_21135, partial [Acidobacteria bacterium]|nr:hypothetical protein [Acidobacteriota bacterium]